MCLGLSFTWSGRARAISQDVVISQVYGGGGNSGAALKNDFVELYNSGQQVIDLSGWSVQYASASGSSWQVTRLAGTLEPGQFYLVQEAAGTGGTTALPTPDATGSIAMSATAGKVALVASVAALSGTCPAGVVDFVGFGAANCSETAPTGALTNTKAALRIAKGCVDTDNNGADFAVTAPNPRNTASPFNTCGVDLPTLPTPIHDLQGSGTISPYANQLVMTEGIVTGVKYNGYFIQAPASEADADPNTSEGVFVYTNATPGATAVVGNRVRVIATVSEFKSSDTDPDGVSMTELTGPGTTLISEGQDLPPAIELGAADFNPASSVFALEKYEGMRVHLASVVSTSPTDGSVNEKDATSTSSGLFFAVLPGTARPFREEGIETPLPVPAEAPSPLTVPVFDGNPERIGVDTFSVFRDPATAKIYPPPAGTTLEVTTGVTVNNVTGPLEYAYRTYIVDAEGWNMPTATTPNASVQPVRERTADEFTVATMNLARFYNTTDDPGSDTVLTTAAFDTRRAKASLAILGVMRAPDIIGVEEVENLETLQAIADRVNADAPGAGKPLVHYDAFLMEGHDVGGIDVGFLVRTDKATVGGIEQIGFDTQFRELDGSFSFLNDRPSLVLHAAILNPPYEPYHVAVVVNHLKALSGVEAADGRVRAKRLAQAVELAGALQALQAKGEHLISVGDYNAFEVNDGYVDVMGLLKGTEVDATRVTRWAPSPVTPPLVDVIELAPKDQRYSFLFDGNAQELDHILASANVTPVDVNYARMNADFPETLRGDAARPERLADHDPIVGYFSLPDIDTTPPVIRGVAPSATVLWPPNHSMMPVTVGVAVSDAADPTPACRITGVSANDGASASDWQLIGALSVNLRAERLGTGDGRRYTIAVACTDKSGNVSLPAATSVLVPHDQRK